MMQYLRISVFLFLFTGIFCFFYYLRKTRILSRKLRDAYDALDEASVERARAVRYHSLTESSKKGFFERMIEDINHKFVYSGLGRHFPGLTVELWTVLLVISAAIVYFLVMLAAKSVSRGLLAAAGYIALVKGVELLLAYRNYKIVDNNLVQFLNQLGNFSIMRGEITGVFHQISRFLPSPLSEVLEECYYDAQTSGDASEALYAMAAKIEHPKFKEIIINIEICTSYTADFKVIVNSIRKNLLDEKKAGRERRSIAEASLVNMFILGILLVVILLIVDNLIEASVWDIIFHTGVGKGAIAVVAVSLLIFLWNVLNAER